MCGIASFCLNPADHIDAVALSKSLLLGIEERGRDATGIATRSESGKATIVKNSLAASVFVRKHLNGMDPSTPLGVLHTRLATQGSPKNNFNNHPIISGRIIGVHNGCLSNDHQLFNRMDVRDRRLGEVDSEAAFAALAFGLELDDKGIARLGSKVTKLTDILEEIDGSAALAWMDMNDQGNVLHVTAISSSPVCWGQTEAGSFVCASTFKALETAQKEVGFKLTDTFKMDDGTYMRVRDGVVEDVQKFDPPWSTYYYTGTSTYKSSYKTSNYASKDTHRPFKLQTPTTTIRDDKEKSDDHYTWTNCVKGETELPATPDPEQDSFAAYVSYGVERLVDNAYWTVYDAREKAIDAFIHQQGENRFQPVAHLHGYMRPGDDVTTYFSGDEVEGQVIEMPVSFPEGLYTLRVWTGEEWALVIRAHDEFYGDKFELPANKPAENGEFVPSENDEDNDQDMDEYEKLQAQLDEQEDDSRTTAQKEWDARVAVGKAEIAIIKKPEQKWNGPGF